MPEYLAPGVYVEEIDLGAKPIEGVSTSTTGFVGVTRRGPINKPVLVTNFGEYLRTFGGFLGERAYGAQRWLPYAMDGFFANGGKRAYVVRVGAVERTNNHITNVAHARLSAGGNARRTLRQPTQIGENAITLADWTGLAQGDDLLIDDGNQQEQVKISRFTDRIELAQKLTKAHSAGVTVLKLPKTGEDVANAEGAQKIRVDKKAGLAQDAFYLLDDGNNREIIQLGEIPATADPVEISLAAALRFSHGPGVGLLAFVPTTEGDIKLAAAAAAGATQIQLSADSGLFAGDWVKIGGAASEFVQLTKKTDDTFAIAPPLKAAHAADDPVSRAGLEATEATLMAPALVAPPSATLSAAVEQGSDTVTVGSAQGLSAGSIVEVLDGASTEYVEVKAVDGASLTLLRSLRYPHPAQTLVRLLPGSLQLVAGPADPDPDRYPEIGTWGNEILVQSEPASIAQAVIKAKGDSYLELVTAQGIEVGATLQLPGNVSATVSRVEGAKVYLAGGLPADATSVIEPAAQELWKRQVRTLEFTLRIVYSDTLEVFSNLSMDARHSRYFARVINGASKLVHVEAAENTPPPMLAAEWRLGGGADGLPVGDEVYIGSDAADADQRTGLFALLNQSDISLVAVPGQTSQNVQLALIAHAERDRYRFALLDAEANATLDKVQTQRSLYDSKYAALYYPWIQIFDPLEKKPVFAPPAGHLCGVYARTDSEVGVHKAPANTVVAQVRALQATVTQAQQDVLNPKGINAVRAFPGRGIRVWGARTISSDPAWRYVNVRRLFIFLEHSIDNATQYAVFEPNDLPLWERLRGSVNAFLTTQWRAGMLQGATAAEAFFVKIGLGETMTQDDIDNGRVIMLIGIAPVKPAEFVIFRVTQMPRGSQVAE